MRNNNRVWLLRYWSRWLFVVNPSSKGREPKQAPGGLLRFSLLGKCDHEIQIACGSRLQGGPRASGELFSLASAFPRAIRFAKEDSGAFEALALIYRTTWPGKKLNSSNGA